MADISITLTLDNSQYQAGIVKAEASIKGFGETAKKVSSDVSDGIKKIADSFNPLQSGISGLTGALTGMLSIGFLEKTAEWANSIENVANAVGMTIPQMLELQSAVTKAGGTAQAASRGIEMFYMKLDQARQGGTAQQYAFERIGISLADLKKYDDQQLFKMTIDALAKMPASAERNRIEVELLSRSFRGIPLTEIQAQMKATSGTFEEQGQVVRSAGDAYKNLNTIITNLRLAVLTIAQPFLDAFKNLKTPVDDLVAGLKVLLQVLAAVMALQFLTFLQSSVTAFVNMAKAIREAAVALEAFSVAEQLAVNATGIGALLNMLLKAVLAIGTFIGAGYLMNRVLKENADANSAAQEAENAKIDTQNKQIAANNEVYTSYARLNERIQEQTKLFDQNQQRQIELIRAREQDIGLSEAQRLANERFNKTFEEYGRQIDSVRARLREAQAARPGSDESRTVSTLAAQIPILERLQSLRAGEAYQAQLSETLKAETDRDNLVTMTQNLNLQTRLNELTTRYAQADMSPLEAENAKIKESWDKIADAEIRAAREKEKVSSLGVNGMGQDRESLIRTNASNNALIEISKNSEAYKNQQDDFTGGWRRAFETYVADLGNANKQAARLFDSFTTTVDSAIDQFVTKGKVSFSDLIKSMIQDLEKFLLKQAAMNLFKASGAGDIFSTAASAGSAEGPLTGLLSGAAKFFGFKAQGGDIPAGGYAMVGEAGPELVRGPASVTSARDTGMMGSGVTNNNYTIQAVDAKSVAQLFYENRMTMFGMTEQARRELPMRNR